MNRVLSRNRFLEGEDGKGCVHPRYGSGGLPPQENVSVSLSKHIYSICQCLLTGNSFLNTFIINCNWEFILGGRGGEA